MPNLFNKIIFDLPDDDGCESRHTRLLACRFSYFLCVPFFFSLQAYCSIIKTHVIVTVDFFFLEH